MAFTLMSCMNLYGQKDVWKYPFEFGKAKYQVVHFNGIDTMLCTGNLDFMEYGEMRNHSVRCGLDSMQLTFMPNNKVIHSDAQEFNSFLLLMNYIEQNLTQNNEGEIQYSVPYKVMQAKRMDCWFIHVNFHYGNEDWSGNVYVWNGVIVKLSIHTTSDDPSHVRKFILVETDEIYLYDGKKTLFREMK